MQTATARTTPACTSPSAGSATDTASVCGYRALASCSGPLTHQPSNSMATKFNRIVVNTSGALRHQRSRLAIDAHAAPAMTDATSAATMPRRAATNAERAGDELPLAADVPHAGAKGDGDGQAGEEERNRLQNALVETAAEEDAQDVARGVAEERADDGDERERDDDRENGADHKPPMRRGAFSAASSGVSFSLNLPR